MKYLLVLLLGLISLNAFSQDDLIRTKTDSYEGWKDYFYKSRYIKINGLYSSYSLTYHKRIIEEGTILQWVTLRITRHRISTMSADGMLKLKLDNGEKIELYNMDGIKLPRFHYSRYGSSNSLSVRFNITEQDVIRLKKSAINVMKIEYGSTFETIELMNKHRNYLMRNL